MTFPLGLILAVLAVHYVADFILQPRWAARNKSSNILALLLHIAIYTACLVPFGFGFAVVNGIVHLLVDAITSRVMAKCYKAKREWWFFVILGLDHDGRAASCGALAPADRRASFPLTLL